MRTLAVLLLLAPAAFADEVDLTPRSRSEHKPASLVVRGEGGTAFAPFGYLGGCISWLTASKLELELGAGGGFPGLQLGIAARQLFGERGGYLLLELAIAGNTRVNRVADSGTQFTSYPTISTPAGVTRVVSSADSRSVISSALSRSDNASLPRLSYG